MSEADRQRLDRRLRGMPGVRSVPRPIAPGGGEAFDLAYVREGSRGATPLLVIPGGPGLASVLPYRGFRRRAVRGGFEVAMAEHRGVGLSRTDRSGRDLPVEAMSVASVVDDLVAVLDDSGWERAVVYGSSYGGYLAQALGAWYPERVAAMILDSASSSVDEEDAAREHLRRLLWSGEAPETAAVAAKLRALVDAGSVPVEETGAVVPVVYELGGAPLVERMLDVVARGRRDTWDWVVRLGGSEVNERHPFYMEADVALALYYRELRAVRPDGLPLDPQVHFAREPEGAPAFTGEPVDLVSALPGFAWPTAVLTGERDMRSVPPTARRTADLLPDGVLVSFARSAHSFLDFHPRVAVTAARAAANGTHGRLPALADRLERLRRPPQARALGAMLQARVAGDRALSAVSPTRRPAGAPG